MIPALSNLSPDRLWSSTRRPHYFRLATPAATTPCRTPRPPRRCCGERRPHRKRVLRQAAELARGHTASISSLQRVIGWAEHPPVATPAPAPTTPAGATSPARHCSGGPGPRFPRHPPQPASPPGCGAQHPQVGFKSIHLGAHPGITEATIPMRERVEYPMSFASS